MKKFVRVVVLAAAGFTQPFFHYFSREGIQIGQLVRVPFGRREVVGAVVGFDDQCSFQAKNISEIFPIIIPLHLIKVLSRSADYYLASLDRFLKSALPRLIRQGKFPEINEKWVRLLVSDYPARGVKQKLVLDKLIKEELPLGKIKEVSSLAVLRNLEEKGIIQIFSKTKAFPQFTPPKFPPLTHEQKQALSEINVSKKPVLLRGVTGSGKTELYLQLVATALAEGKSSLVLVPEISLTPQLVGRFEQYFPGHIALFHSRRSDTERASAWFEVLSGHKKIIIGSRSAVFAPVSDLGLIVLDEYHDWSFKQDSYPFYDARTIAELLAEETGSKLILGSATPRVEDYYLAQK